MFFEKSGPLIRLKLPVGSRICSASSWSDPGILIKCVHQLAQGLQCFNCALYRSACTYLCALSPPAADPHCEVWELVCLFLILIAFLPVHQNDALSSSTTPAFLLRQLFWMCWWKKKIMKNKLLFLFLLLRDSFKFSFERDQLWVYWNNEKR